MRRQATQKGRSFPLLLATCVVNVCKCYGPVINLALKGTVVKEGIFFFPLSLFLPPLWNERRCFVMQLNGARPWQTALANRLGGGDAASPPWRCLFFPGGRARRWHVVTRALRGEHEGGWRVSLFTYAISKGGGGGCSRKKTVRRVTTTDNVFGFFYPSGLIGDIECRLCNERAGLLYALA